MFISNSKQYRKNSFLHHEHTFRKEILWPPYFSLEIEMWIQYAVSIVPTVHIYTPLVIRKHDNKICLLWFALISLILCGWRERIDQTQVAVSRFFHKSIERWALAQFTRNCPNGNARIYFFLFSSCTHTKGQHILIHTHAACEKLLCDICEHSIRLELV